MGLIFNTFRKSQREAKHYYHTTVLYGDEKYDILLTEHEVKQAISRADKNLEDIPKRWYDYILFWR